VNIKVMSTDWPICRMRTFLKLVREPGLTLEEALILWKTAAQLFRLVWAGRRIQPQPSAEQRLLSSTLRSPKSGRENVE
jgi:hypothetical protein